MSSESELSHKRQRHESQLDQLRDELTSLQRELLEEFWQHYRQHGEWPLTRPVHSRHCKRTVKEALQELSGGIVTESRGSSSRPSYQLTAIGVLLTQRGREYFGLLVRYMEFLRELYLKAPEQVSFSREDFQKALSLSDEQLDVLGELIQLAHLWGGGSTGSGWSIHVPDEIEDLPKDGPVDEALEGLLFRWFRADNPDYSEDQQRQASTSPLLPLFGGPPEVDSVDPALSVDVLKRRYQVFVSSTYEDLQEERQHAIQALLETKCIPLGMELFPAASVEQWELIKRVIRECDYYLVIVAGRYGSIGESGIGYTEREFDFAVSIDKPVIGFYHRNPETLPVTKSEQTDAGRERLKTFTQKIKKRLCRAWDSPAELGSAIKSAIFGELESNPKPGWIRADAVPGLSMVEKLKQRIADLEEQLKKQIETGGPTARSEEHPSDTGQA